MTYFGFLAQFLGIPLVILSIITILDYARGKWMPAALNARRPWVVLLGMCVVALVYTTPWDNYLVATEVWWYDIDLVSGIILGYVPIEEYTFFLVQPVMTGLFLLLLVRYLPTNPRKADSVRFRVVTTSVTAIFWLGTVILLILTLTTEAFKPATYLALELSWALIPVLVQLAYGADTLRRHWLPVLLAIALPTIYLSWADSLAIGAGTWTIDPAQSLNIFIGGVLPIEEFVFFLITNTLVALGITLVLAEESQERLVNLGRYAIFRPLVRLLEPNEAMNKRKKDAFGDEYLAISK